jgi:hypothetical protein
MNSIISSLLLIVFSFACGKNATQSNGIPIIAASSDTIKNDTTNYSFHAFWQVFEQAVIDLDSNKLILLTEFPLQSRGPMDSDPIIKFNKSEYFKVFHEFLNQTVYPSTGFERIKKRDHLIYSVTKKWARVDDIEFRKIQGIWRMNLLHLDYPTIEKLEIKNNH